MPAVRAATCRRRGGGRGAPHRRGRSARDRHHGVNTGDFGRTTGERFIDLLRALDAVEGIERYRISSIEPNLLTDEIIDFCASSTKFQHHFHIPLQSGSDRILGLMRRRYTTARFADRIAAVRRRMPDAFIGIDVIVGFPGETEEVSARPTTSLPGWNRLPAYFPLFGTSRHAGRGDARQGAGFGGDAPRGPAGGAVREAARGILRPVPWGARIPCCSKARGAGA